MLSRQAPDAKASSLMVMLCAIWGFQQIALKAAAPDMAPILQISLRSGAAAILVALFLRCKGMGVLPPKDALWAGWLAGALFSMEYLLAGEGLRFTSASHMSVMLYTAPAFAALGLHFRIPEERLSLAQWGGMFLAFSGVAVMFYGPAPEEQLLRNTLFGDFLGVMGGLAWGATTVVIRSSKLSEAPAAQTVFIQLISAFFILLAASALLDKLSFSNSRVLVGSLAYQTIIVSFASLLIWFWLLKKYLASLLGVLSFLTPMFGVCFGVVALGESVDAKFIVGATLILGGIALVSGWGALKKLLKRKSGEMERK